MNRSALAAWGTSPAHVPGWRDRAACLEMEDPELWFPIGTTGSSVPQIAEAQAVCRRCPVREECLRHALDSGEEFGIWGGVSEDERRKMKRRADRARLDAARSLAELVSA